MFSFDSSQEALWCLPQKRLRQKFDKFHFSNNFASTSLHQNTSLPQEHTFSKFQLIGKIEKNINACECKSDSLILLGQSFACFALVWPNWGTPLEYKYQGAKLVGKIFQDICSKILVLTQSTVIDKRGDLRDNLTQNKKTSSQAPSYASSKLWPTYWQGWSVELLA